SLSNIRPVLKTKGINQPNDNRGYSYHKLNDGSSKIATLKTDNSGYIKTLSAFYPEKLPSIIKECLQEDESLKWNNTTPSNRIKGVSLYRVAIELADGSYTQYSNIDYADTVRKDENGKYVYGDAVKIRFRPSVDSSKYTFDVTPYEVSMPEVFGYHTVEIEFKDIEQIKTLMEIGVVRSVALFMTPPVFAYDVEDYDNYTTYFFGVWKGQQRWQVVGQGKDKPERMSEACVYPLFMPINKEIFKVFENGVFYKVKKLTLLEISDYISNGSWENNKISIDIYANDIKNLTANVQLPVPNVSEDNKIVFANAYTYNSKQHLFDLRYSIFEGYSLFGKDVDNLLYMPVIERNTSLYCAFKGKYENQSFETKQVFPKEYCTIDNNSIKTFIPQNLYMQYSMIDIDMMEVYATFDINQKEYKITLYKTNKFVEHTGQNTTFNIVFNPKSNSNEVLFENNFVVEGGVLNIMNFDIRFGTDSLFRENWQEKEINLSEKEEYKEKANIIRLSNVLQLTETNNPMACPNEENYSFGQTDNRIIAVRSNTGTQNLNDRNFGTSPLYVFCTDGIYAMTVGAGTVAYSSVVKLNDESIVSPYVCNTPLGIVFLSKSGLYIIGRSGITNIGERMKGRPTVTNQKNYSQILQYINNAFESSLDSCEELEGVTPAFVQYMNFFADINIEFFEEIASAQIYYDTINKEIVFSKMKNIVDVAEIFIPAFSPLEKDKTIEYKYNIPIAYSYVYNIEYKTWYKRKDCYRVHGNGMLSSYDYDKERNAYYINIYSIEEEYKEQKDICRNIAIITKPILLETRQYKHIERTIFNIAWSNYKDFFIVVMGSEDGVNYSILKAIHQKAVSNKTKEIKKQDYYLSRTLKTTKYITIWMLARELSNTKIANVLFMDKIQRGVAGIR
ncbi:MAG: hypothetical protein Q4Q06_06950, partial [Bacteroidota bacterium]|nr:hypothetical protein [Bacteroidota bacterium]